MRAIVYRTACPPPWFVLNRYYPGVVIGAAVRIGRHRLLSVVWRRP